MGKDSGIPWCDNTFNTHWSCTEVSDECSNCYAREFAARFGYAWGKDAARRTFGEKHWNDLLRWNRAAERGAVGKDGRRILVFINSMSDLFESRDDLNAVRDQFWDYARRCTSLRLLLLTKRPQNIGRMVPTDLRGAPHMWYGTTVGLPSSLWRVDALLEHAGHAPVRFVSIEPLLERTSFAGRLGPDKANWAIIGSESGDGARPMETAWAQEIIDECDEAQIPVFMKQADEASPGISAAPPAVTPSHELPARNAPYRRPDLRKGPDGLRRRHWIVERPYINGAQRVEWPA